MSRSLRPFHPGLALLVLLSSPPARADSYRLVLPRNAPAPVRFGAAELARDLVEAGHPQAHGSRGIVVTVATSGPVGAEAFIIQRRGAALRVVGGDAVGAMYGLLEIGEQAAEGTGMPLLEAVRPTIRRPYLPLRADSPTIRLGADGEPPRLLADGDFWRRYLSAMARGRFDLLHLHGFVDPATGRPCSLLERLMPAAGTPDARARQFVADLRSLGALCRDRGIRLAVTDDDASEAPAAAASARRLLAAIPGLWALGARVAGPNAPALSAALARQVAPRPFLTWPELSSEESAGGRLASLWPPLSGHPLMVLPVNAGSFALPYPLLDTRPLPSAPLPTASVLSPSSAPTHPQAGTRPEGAPFADPRFLQPGRSGGPVLLWELPAGRIAPSLPWCDPSFIRLLVRSLAMIAPASRAAQGLLVEPPESFFSSLIPHPSSLMLYPAALEPAWWWHRAWGRLAYDPSEPLNHLVAAFQRRYGQEPGWHIQAVLARISAVVPLIAAMDAGHPAQTDPSAPEREPDSLAAWEAGPALDPETLLDIPTWARMRLEGDSELASAGGGRLDPVQISFQLAEAAMRVRNEVDTVEILHPRHLEEWHALRRQIEALCHLADFGARRLSAAAHLELYRRTGDEMELELASGDAELAVISWTAMQRMLAPGGEKEVGHMTMPADPPPMDGPFAGDAALLAQCRAELSQELALPRAAPRIAHVPIQRATPTRAERIATTVMSGGSRPVVTLAYRLADQAGEVGPEHERPMTRLFETRAFYQAEIQGPELSEGFLEYQIRATGGSGASTVWPGPDQWRRVPVTQDEAGPTIRPLSAVFAAGSVLLACEAADPSGIRQVWVHVRPLTAREPWRVIELSPDGVRFTARVPLTADGLQYRFEAADTWGNRSTAPGFAEATPYLVILPPAGRRGAPSLAFKAR